MPSDKIGLIFLNCLRMRNLEIHGNQSVHKVIKNIGFWDEFFLNS